MLFGSKAKEISKLLDLYYQKVIDSTEYQTRLSTILNSSYRPFSSGVTEEEEIKLLMELLSQCVINDAILQDQINKIKRAAAFGYESTSVHREKKSYAGPLIMSLIGGLLCAFIVTLIIGIPLVIIGCVMFWKRHDYNTKITMENIMLSSKVNY